MDSANISARAVAEYIIAKTSRRHMSFAKLHLMLYLVQRESFLQAGRPIFREPVYARAEGPRVDTIDPKWYRQATRRQRGAHRRFRALEARTFTWATRMRARRGCNVQRLNIPGGWSDFDARAQRSGLLLAQLGP